MDADEVGADGGPGDLYRLEDGVLVIDWSPDVEFSLNSSMGGTKDEGLNSSSGDFRAENVSSDSASTSASLGFSDTGFYGGAASGSHLGWASWDPQADSRGRHTEYGRRVTDLVGVFSIEMNIKLGSNFSTCPGTAEWMPCL